MPGTVWLLGRPIIEHLAVAQVLARMKVVSSVAVATTFRILVTADRLESGESSRDARAARRTHVNINKYWKSMGGKIWCPVFSPAALKRFSGG